MTKAELETAKKRFKFAMDADKNQRAREKEDLGFYEGDSQWSDDIKTLRGGQQAQNNSPAVPARPCLTINKIRDPIRKIQNDELQADFGISITAADDFDGNIDENEIELREGLARRIQRQSYAQDAVMWGASRAAICGRGFFGYSTRWVESDSFDQEIIYERFHDQFSVLGDPSREQPDGSDSDYWFVSREFPWDIYREEFAYRADGRKNPVARDGINDNDWDAMCELSPAWIKREGENRSVRVTKYWRYKRERYEIVLMDDGSVVKASDLDDATLNAIPPERRRERIVKRVKCSTIDGYEDGAENALEEYDWAGRFLPVIEITGEAMHVFDQERRSEGLTRPARDPQKAFNVMVSTAVETIGLAPRSPWLVAAGAIEGFQSQWDESAIRNRVALFYNAFDPSTMQPLPKPERNVAEPPIQAMAMMIGAFDQAIMATIGQANLADTHPDVRSGTMASTIIDEAARGTSNYLANLIRSLHYAGEVLNDLLYPIYGIRPGRIVSMVNGSKKLERVMMSTPEQPRPFVPAQNGGMPQPFNPQQHAGQQAKTYTLTKDGSFNVAIEVNKFYETKQQETLALMASIIEKSPEQLAIIGDLFMDAAGNEEMAKRYKAVLAPPIQEMLKEGQPVDPRLTQAMQMGQQLAQEMMQLKADKHARIEQAQIKALSDTTTTDHDNATKLQIAQSHDATLLAIEEMKIKLTEQAKAIEYLTKADELRQEAARTQEAFMEERRLSGEQQDHEHTVAHHDRAHELGMEVVRHRHAKDELEHEAAVLPPSTNGSGE